MPDRSQGPFRGLYDMFAELNRMREHWTEIEPTQGRTHANAWVPVVDIFASGDDLVIRCELAGVARDDVEISLGEGRLCISGDRTGAPEEGPDVSYYVRERRYGPFRRTINLPEEIESDRINATIADGLLEIVIEAGVQPREHERIEVRGADPGEVRLDVATRAGSA